MFMLAANLQRGGARRRIRVNHPEPERPVFADGERETRRSGQRDCQHAVRVAGKHPQTLPRRGVPEAQRFVRAARKQIAGVRRDCHRRHRALMPGEHAQARAVAHVPEAKRFVRAARNGAAAVRRDGDGDHVFLMPLQNQPFLRRPHLPNARGAVAPI